MTDICSAQPLHSVRVSPERRVKNKNANPTQITAEHIFRTIYNNNTDTGFNFYSGVRGTYYNDFNVPKKGYYGAEGWVSLARKEAGNTNGAAKNPQQLCREMGLPVAFGGKRQQQQKTRKTDMIFADNAAVKKVADPAAVAVPIQKKPHTSKPSVARNTSNSSSLATWWLS